MEWPDSHRSQKPILRRLWLRHNLRTPRWRRLPRDPAWRTGHMQHRKARHKVRYSSNASFLSLSEESRRGNARVTGDGWRFGWRRPRATLVQPVEALRDVYIPAGPDI